MESGVQLGRQRGVREEITDLLQPTLCLLRSPSSRSDLRSRPSAVRAAASRSACSRRPTRASAKSGTVPRSAGRSGSRASAALCRRAVRRVLRRSRPVTVLVVVAAACALGAGPLSAGATAVLGTAGVSLALYTVATERDTFTTVLSVLALATWQSLQNITDFGGADGPPKLPSGPTDGGCRPRTPAPASGAGHPHEGCVDRDADVGGRPLRPAGDWTGGGTAVAAQGAKTVVRGVAGLGLAVAPGDGSGPLHGPGGPTPSPEHLRHLHSAGGNALLQGARGTARPAPTGPRIPTTSTPPSRSGGCPCHRPDRRRTNQPVCGIDGSAGMLRQVAGG